MFGMDTKPIIVYVDRNRLQFYGGKLSSIMTLDIPGALLQDLEVNNLDGLYTLVNQWVKQNGLGGNRLFFVLGPSTYFEKVIMSTTDTEQETEILKFYDMVPFEELLTKVISEGPTAPKKAFATNSAYVEAFRHAFLLQGIHVVGVVPAMVLGPLASKRWMDAEMGSYILKHIDVLLGQSIVDVEEQGQMVNSPAPSAPNSKNNPRLMIMVGILGVLLLVLIFYAFIHH